MTLDFGLWTLDTVPSILAAATFFNNIFNPEIWSRLPFHFWSVVFFVFGCNIGSFLNVCIHRLPLRQSIVSPPSHCPHCKYSIPWYLNIPLVTWLSLHGKCRNCGAPISVRYFLVELLTALTFLACWIFFGHQSVALALIYCGFLSGLIVATFIDFEHFIIPDEITIGGMVVGVVVSLFCWQLHIVNGRIPQTWLGSLWESIAGLGVGAGIIYFILRAGKLLFGRQRIEVPSEAKVIFSETSVFVADQEIPYEELFYRRSDVVTLHAQTVELADRCYRDVRVRLTPEKLQIGEDEFNPEEVPHLEAASVEIVLPREAMGFGDVKFMAAIGAFLGWRAVLFSLMASSVVGSVVGITLILMRKREWSSRLPYGPYIALAAAIWIFGGKHFFEMLFAN
jgi:leader peptidase (prepilin peptidase)/N-methyltransferase